MKLGGVGIMGGMLRAVIESYTVFSGATKTAACNEISVEFSFENLTQNGFHLSPITANQLRIFYSFRNGDVLVVKWRKKIEINYFRWTSTNIYLFLMIKTAI